MISYLGEIGSLPQVIDREELIKYLKRIDDGDRLARDRVIKHSLRLIANVIEKKFLNTCLDQEDLFAVGLIGLIKAVDSFNLKKNKAFSTYASICITNEIVSFFRKEKKRFNDVSLSDSFYIDNDGLGIKLEDKLEDETIDLLASCERKDTNKVIRKVILELSEREQFVIKKYFYENLSECQIAKLLGIHQSWVNRLKNGALKKIDERLQELGITNDEIDIVTKK